MAYTGMMPVDGESMDIPTMAEMTAEQYRSALEYKLFFVDHHGVFRSAVGEFPLAVTKEQFADLRAHLETLVDKVGS